MTNADFICLLMDNSITYQDPILDEAARRLRKLEFKVIELSKQTEKFDTNHWFCPHCKTKVEPIHVTYDETHESCGTPLI